MIIAFICICLVVAVWMYPNLCTTLKCAGINMIVSIRNIYFTYKKLLNGFREIIRNYRMGAITLLFDFVLLKCRAYLAELFENGLVVTDRKNIVEIVYHLRDTKYRVVVPIKMGPRPISRLQMMNGKDVTEGLIREQLGPYGDFHSIPTTPRMLGYPEGLNVIYRREPDNIRTYAADEVINVGK